MLLGTRPIDVMIVKENLYSTDLSYYTASYSLILVFSMLVIIIFGVAFRFYQMTMSLKKDAIKLRTSFMSKTNVHTTAMINETDLLAMSVVEENKEKDMKNRNQSSHSPLS